ncbi:MAG: hypothetical protein OXB94_04575 [Nitrospira sp.]|nr:hypothetical protein [Nitrospira sp.]
MNRLDWFSAFKYLVYAALVANAALFFKDDWEAAAHVFRDGLQFAQIIHAFAASIDTAAWVILLLLFELETCQLSDEVMTRPIGRAIRGLRALCYVVIVYAFTGYLGKALGFGLYVPVDILDACALAMQQFALLAGLDEYRALNAGNCAGITGTLFVNGQTRTVAEAGTLIQATRLAWVDVVNSGTWLLILALLELDVRPGVKGLFPGWFGAVNRHAKSLLYAVIAGAAVYWGLFGTFLDFWDASLWIAAFIFIERNVFKWEQEPGIGGEDNK